MAERKIPLKLSVVIPVYNERQTIEELLCRVQAVEVDKEIIIVDNGSTDGTRELLQDLVETREKHATFVELPQTGHRLYIDNIRIFFQQENHGKGAALRRGFREAQGEIVLVQDADLEYDPQDYHRLLAPIERGAADVVYGSRFMGSVHHVMVFWQYMGNKILTRLSNIFTTVDVSDVWTCYKVFKREVLQEIELREDHFGFEPEVTAKVSKGGWRLHEVPISYSARTYAEGKKITWRDGLKGIWCILRYNIFG